ncbi:unnamed protein product [Owenia fusiformis]|uniref:Deoxynucleoside triphosphate triphosphohydrolase SAMHD1 n=1 Tax=Owenia fusiformis TaxID=6347 RepID=A0A8J1Y7V0_OWEFU|nr:unnamed protein product [Owenia fusiformis]
MSAVKRLKKNDAGESSSIYPVEQPKNLIYTDFKDWTVHQVCEHLMQNDLNDVAVVFEREAIAGAVLKDLTEEHLQKMEIKPMGQRLKVLQLIRELHSLADAEHSTKVFNDPIHGHIEVSSLCAAIIDTKQFQRLRFLKQLGGCYWVFPGATHNRFEHSIGVCWLAGQLVRAIRTRQPFLHITDADIICVQIAGLCHDLGHGPFSHMFDGKFIPKIDKNSKWRHEDASVQMFDYLVEDNNLIPLFEQHGLTERDRIFIKEQIAGPSTRNKNWNYRGRPKSKSFLYEIVANKRNGIDVDKWDYFARDCHHLGFNNNFDHLRFIKFARVLEVDGVPQICSRDKEANCLYDMYHTRNVLHRRAYKHKVKNIEVGNLYDMFHTRSVLHRRAYQHKVNNIVETMITEALVEANDHILLEGKDGVKCKMSEAIYDMVAFCQLNDTIYNHILISNDPNLDSAKVILKMIERRELYRCIGQTQPRTHTKAHKLDEDVIRKEVAAHVPPKDREYITTSDLVVHVIKYDYGMHEKNPMDNVRFYKKDDPNKAVMLRREQVSQMLPEKFAEEHIRVYCKKSDPRSIEISRAAFANWCENEQDVDKPRGGDSLAMDMTPCKPLQQENEDISDDEEPPIVPFTNNSSQKRLF